MKEYTLEDLADMCPTCHHGDPVCETHLRHTDDEFRAAYDLTGGRFQVFVYPDSPDTIECRSRTIANGLRPHDAETVQRVLQRWLDEQCRKENHAGSSGGSKSDGGVG